MRSGQQNNQPKLTFRQRLDNIKFEGKIPDHFIDHLISLDIMDDPVRVNDKHIMDYKGLVTFWKGKIQSYEAKTKDGKHYHDTEANPVFESVGAGRTETYKMERLHDLREEIEGWVFLQELEYKVKIRDGEKAETIRSLEEDIQKTNNAVDALLNENENMPADEKEHALNIHLHHLDLLNKAKAKLTLGTHYYNQPGVLRYEITRLLAKQERQPLSEDEKQELSYCYERLDKPKSSLLIKRVHPGLFDTVLPRQGDNTEAGIPVISFAKFNMGSDDL
jgi:hypothetical protein